MPREFSVTHPHINNNTSCYMIDSGKCIQEFMELYGAMSYVESIRDTLSLHFSNTNDTCSNIEVAQLDFYTFRNANPYKTTIIETIGICNTITDEN